MWVQRGAREAALPARQRLCDSEPNGPAGGQRESQSKECTGRGCGNWRARGMRGRHAEGQAQGIGIEGAATYADNATGKRGGGCAGGQVSVQSQCFHGAKAGHSIRMLGQPALTISASAAKAKSGDNRIKHGSDCTALHSGPQEAEVWSNAVGTRGLGQLAEEAREAVPTAPPAGTGRRSPLSSNRRRQALKPLRWGWSAAETL
jgi:hypothetical protein